MDALASVATCDASDCREVAVHESVQHASLRRERPAESQDVVGVMGTASAGGARAARLGVSQHASPHRDVVDRAVHREGRIARRVVGEEPPGRVARHAEHNERLLIEPRRALGHKTGGLRSRGADAK